MITRPDWPDILVEVSVGKVDYSAYENEPCCISDLLGKYIVIVVVAW